MIIHSTLCFVLLRHNTVDVGCSDGADCEMEKEDKDSQAREMGRKCLKFEIILQWNKNCPMWLTTMAHSYADSISAANINACN